MATVKAVYLEIPFSGPGKAWQITWPLMLLNDVGEGVQLTEFHDRSVQVEGTFGAAGNLAIEGSNDGTLASPGSHYEVINDPSETSLNFTTAKIRQVLEAVWLIRPHVTAGDGTTSLTVTMFARRTQP